MPRSTDFSPQAVVAPSMGEEGHVPVLREEALQALALDGAQVVVDATFGGGGYTRAMLERAPDCQVIAVDRDPDAIARAYALQKQFPQRLHVFEGTFSKLDQAVEAAGFEAVDGVVFDFGVSSFQLDEAERGFSFRFDAPLDMRMQAEGLSAADLLAELSEAQLADVLYYYGEERMARPLARALVKARMAAPITTTGQLVEIVAKVVRHKPHEIHPATRTFQGLRIAVNAELHEIAEGLNAAEKVLRPGGRLAVVSFHSLEDRIAKRMFAERSETRAKGSRHMPEAVAPSPTFSLLHKKPIEPSAAEIAANPRARSAKLRVAVRLDAAHQPLRPQDLSLYGVPPLPRELLS